MKPAIFVALFVVIGCSTNPSGGTTSTDASEETTGCPNGPALECPSGCERSAIDQYDEGSRCLRTTDRALCFPPPPRAKCLGLASCRRDSAGHLLRVFSGCVLAEYDFCTGAEDTKVLSASPCDGG